MKTTGLRLALLLGASLSAVADAQTNDVERSGATPMETTTTCCAVLELRQYTLKPGQREVLIDLFDGKFVAGLEEADMKVIGQFRDLDAPDRFVWLRGFTSMPQRKRALETFYGGPMWKDNRNAANATMIDSDNVLLLRPATATSGFALPRLRGDQRPAGLVVAHLHYLRRPVDASTTQDLERRLRSVLQSSTAQLQAVLVSEHAENTFPALPVRLNEEVLIWMAGFADQSTYDAQRAALENVAMALKPYESAPPERLHLSPTSQSLLRGTGEGQP